eukprot:m.100584 g.100584  ORF g.100584 m.100584 type:complete len:523 (+) comp10354_c0_seq2:58-1626(+)
MGCSNSKNAGDLSTSPAPQPMASTSTPAKRKSQTGDTNPNPVFTHTPNRKSVRSPAEVDATHPQADRAPTLIVKAIAPEPEKRVSTLPAYATDENPQATTAVMHIVTAGVHEAVLQLGGSVPTSPTSPTPPEQPTNDNQSPSPAGEKTAMKRTSSKRKSTRKSSTGAPPTRGSATNLQRASSTRSTHSRASQKSIKSASSMKRKGTLSRKLEASEAAEAAANATPSVRIVDTGVSPRQTAMMLGCTQDEVHWDQALCQEDPVEGLASFLTENRVRTDSFFKFLDKDCNKGVSNDEFIKQLLVLGMPLHPEDDRDKLEILAKSVNGENGVISYLDVSTMRKEYEKKVRERRRSTPTSGIRRGSGSFRTPDKAAGRTSTEFSPRAGSRTSTRSAAKSPRNPAVKVQEEFKMKQRERAQAYDTHLQRQEYIERRASQKKLTPSKIKQESFDDRMQKARESTKIGERRTHPYLDEGGANRGSLKHSGSRKGSTVSINRKGSTVSMNRRGSQRSNVVPPGSASKPTV